jgi:hypothetical protein
MDCRLAIVRHFSVQGGEGDGTRRRPAWWQVDLVVLANDRFGDGSALSFGLVCQPVITLPLSCSAPFYGRINIFADIYGAPVPSKSTQPEDEQIRFGGGDSPACAVRHCFGGAKPAENLGN